MIFKYCKIRIYNYWLNWLFIAGRNCFLEVEYLLCMDYIKVWIGYVVQNILSWNLRPSNTDIQQTFTEHLDITMLARYNYVSYVFKCRHLKCKEQWIKCYI